MTTVLLLPVFFAYSGLNTHLGSGWTWSFVGALAALMLAGFVGKYIAGLLTMRRLGFDWRSASAMGGLMNARGLMILIFINVGLAQGIIGDRLFGLLVLVVVITTAMAMPIYRATLTQSDEAAARAERARTCGGEQAPNSLRAKLRDKIRSEDRSRGTPTVDQKIQHM
ncbi:MAG: cation:proton antiporter [Pseudonocardiaceae bacterium]